MNIQLLDLRIFIDKPYVYQHLGQYEHHYIFNEINIAKPFDCLGQTNYPKVTISIAKYKLKNFIFFSKI